MTNGHGQRVCSIVSRWGTVQPEQELHHLLDLPLVCATVSHNGPLHFGGRVLHDLAPRFDGGQNRHAARVTELEGTSRVVGIEKVLDDDTLGPAL